MVRLSPETQSLYAVLAERLRAFKAAREMLIARLDAE